MRCDEVVELLSAEMDGALESEEPARLAEHLATCESCRTRGRDLRALIAGVRASALRGERAPAAMRARLEATFGARARRLPLRRSIFWAAGMLGAAASVVLYLTSRAGAAGALDQVTGSVEVVRDGRARGGTRGAGLSTGDVVRTGAGAAHLRLGRRGMVVLGEWAQLVVGHTVGQSAARLERGRAAFDVAPGIGQFRVETPVGDVIVAGTAFEVQIITPDDVTALSEQGEEARNMISKALGLTLAGLATAGTAAMVHVSRGAVTVEGGGAQVALTAGQSAAVNAGEVPRRVDTPQPAAMAANLAADNMRLRAELDTLRAQLADTRGPRQSGTTVREGVSSGKAIVKTVTCDGATCDDEIKDLIGKHGEHVVLKRPEIPMTDQEKELVKDARAAATARVTDDVRALYAEAKGSPPAPSTDFKTMVEELFEAVPPMDLVRSGLGNQGKEPGAGASVAERLLWQMRRQTSLVREELAKSLPPERAKELAGGGDGVRVMKTIKIDHGDSPPP